MNDGWEREFKAQEERRRAEVMALPTSAVTHRATLAPPTDGDVLVTASIGPSGEAVALWSSTDGERALTANTTQPGWATFPNARATRPTSARVTRHDGSDPIEVVEIADLALAHVTVQPLPHGRVLIVGARCHWRTDSGAERNAAVFDGDGTLVLEQTLGDGIEHVLTTAGGAVWVGYFDEGVFGNYGWGGASSPEPIGAADSSGSPRICRSTGAFRTRAIRGTRSQTATHSTWTERPPGLATTPTSPWYASTTTY